MPVTVTETAAREICKIINDQELDAGAIRLRVGVKGGGCSGFNYLLDLTETQKDTDEIWEYAYSVPVRTAERNGAAEQAANASSPGAVAVEESECEKFTLRVICDPKSYLYLNGTVIDFKDELMGRGFVFNNPNATSSCGCGSSFNV